jgi:hypothetical protein
MSRSEGWTKWAIPFSVYTLEPSYDFCIRETIPLTFGLKEQVFPETTEGATSLHVAQPQKAQSNITATLYWSSKALSLAWIKARWSKHHFSVEVSMNLRPFVTYYSSSWSLKLRPYLSHLKRYKYYFVLTGTF